MSANGVRLTLLIGPTVAVAVPPPVLEALEDVQVTHKDEGRSGFSITFRLGRTGPLGLQEFPLLATSLLQPFNRVLVIVTFGVLPQVLMDGIITTQELAHGQAPGTSTVTVKGEDVSVMMDREQRSAEHPAQDEYLIALKLIGMYAQYGLIPAVVPPGAVDTPSPTDRTPVQQCTDLQYLRKLADRHGYVFYVTSGPAPFANTAYWGPPIRAGLPQRAITVDMGPETNAHLGEATKDGLGPALVEGRIQDRETNQQVSVRTFASGRPPLAALPSLLVDAQNVRREQLRTSAVSSAQALARAQGRVEANRDGIRLEGELDAGSYGGLLNARSLVGLRGAGYAYDGLYYVKEVTHRIARGRYSQRFVLTREGLGSTTPVVVP